MPRGSTVPTVAAQDVDALAGLGAIDLKDLERHVILLGLDKEIALESKECELEYLLDACVWSVREAVDRLVTALDKEDDDTASSGVDFADLANEQLAAYRKEILAVFDPHRLREINQPEAATLCELARVPEKMGLLKDVDVAVRDRQSEPWVTSYGGLSRYSSDSHFSLATLEEEEDSTTDSGLITKDPASAAGVKRRTVAPLGTLAPAKVEAVTMSDFPTRGSVWRKASSRGTPSASAARADPRPTIEPLALRGSALPPLWLVGVLAAFVVVLAGTIALTATVFGCGLETVETGSLGVVWAALYLTFAALLFSHLNAARCLYTEGVAPPNQRAAQQRRLWHAGSFIPAVNPLVTAACIQIVMAVAGVFIAIASC